MNKEKVYEQVTAKILAGLETAGSWQSMIVGGSLPKSIEGHPYQGINYMMLKVEQMEKEYKTPIWGTFRAIRKHGGIVRKGQKGTIIVFWKLMDYKDRENPGEIKQIPFLRYSFVFNADQVDWHDETGRKMIEELTVDKDNEFQTSAEEIVDGWDDKPEIKIVSMSQAPSYSPHHDRVTMPEITQFVGTDYYYKSLFHELVHSTGHENRLNRGLTTDFGSEQYSREELVAELGAAFLSEQAELNINMENSAAYIRGWKENLEANTDWIVWAAARAGKAANMILENQKVREEVA
ncbi:MAG: DUF1738 domain-containing protein, partial [Proteobacteria bacterium]|nr:DUF1738 domain-containing protein [Pseudomonadota bacterium]